MIEAFEIGVSLALRDGVSESIARAQRNVEALEKAVNANGLSVRALRDAGARAVSLVGAEPGRAQKRETQGGARREPIEVAPGRADFLPDIRRGAADADRPLRDVQQADAAAATPQVAPAQSAAVSRADDAGVADEESESAAPSPRGREFLAETRAAAPNLGEQTQALGPAPAALPMYQPAEAAFDGAGDQEEPGRARLPVEPLPADRAAQAAAAGLPFPAGQPDRNFVPQVRDDPAALNAGLPDEPTAAPWIFELQRGDVSVAQGLPLVDGTQDRVGGVMQDSPSVGGSVAPGLIAGGQTQRAYTDWDDRGANPRGALREPPASWPTLHSVVAPSLQQAAGAGHSVAPQGRDSPQEKFGGDVYLDGVLMGRWVSRFLKREVERAEAGPTGFDAKRGRLLPGATVGG